MKIFSALKQIFTNEKFQLVYGILLMILIPLVIITNTLFILGRYNQDIDAVIQKWALSVGRTFSAMAKGDLYNQEILQKKIGDIGQSSPEIMGIQILEPHEEGFRVVASLQEEEVGKTFDFFYYNLAWQQRENEALATDSLALSQIRGEDAGNILKDSGRFWLVSMPLRDDSKNKVALLSMKLSSEIVNQLTNDNWRSSVFSLALTVLITILFLAASTRLWGYVTLYEKIKEVDTMKDDFISMASHELRTPITAVRGYTSMILEGSFGPLSDKMRDGISRVMASSNRLGVLVEDLLEVSRIEQGRVEIHLQLVDAQKIVQDTLAELKPLADEKKLELRYENPSSEGIKIYADPDKLKQVLVNIIGNAIKYTLKGSVTIFSDNKRDYHKAIIRVRDSGVGISAEDQKHLYEKFYRIKNEYTQKIIGTGLGLWITRQLVELMKGNITIESMEGVGTQVALEFPSVKK